MPDNHSSEHLKKVVNNQQSLIEWQQHINALLFEGFNVWVDKDERSLLHFDKLNNPTLKANN
jgi:hypothetical protein